MTEIASKSKQRSHPATQMETASLQRGFSVWPSGPNNIRATQVDATMGQSGQAFKAPFTVHKGWQKGLSLSHLSLLETLTWNLPASQREGTDTQHILKATETAKERSVS